jgi:acyl-CoA reductase-like NAD-dependent aldehyde dehydrogenase
MDFVVPSYAGDQDPRWSLLPSDPYPMLVDGELIGSGSTIPLESPRDKKTYGSFFAADAEIVERAVASARRALTGPWARTTPEERGALLARVGELLVEHADELAFLDAVDAGKTVTSTYTGDFTLSLDALAYYPQVAAELQGGSADLGVPSIAHRRRFEPIGVVVEILPWNGPLWTGVQQMAAILAGGNVAIMKPAELASASWMRLAQLLVEVGFPPGVVQVVAGTGREVGEAFVTHPGVDLVSITGGVETGTHVLGTAAPQLKRVALELGGKNPNIVLDDADLDSAAFWGAMGGFSATGQVCVAGSRVLVDRSVHDAYVEKLIAQASALTVGEPLEPGSDLGPLIGGAQYEKVWRYIEAGRSEATLALGGEAYTDDLRAAGWYVPPTVFVDVDPASPLATDEIFGPVIAVTAFDGVEEALALANDTTYGLAAGVFTGSAERAETFAAGLQAGQVYVNRWFAPRLRAPALGYKRSGMGGVGIHRYLQEKNIYEGIA